MTPARRLHQERDPRRAWAFDEIDALGALIATVTPAFARGRTAPDEAGDLAAWLGEHGIAEVDVTQPQLEALVVLGILGRVVSGGEARLVWIAGSPFAQSGASPAQEVDALARTAAALEMVLEPGVTVPDALDVVAARIAERGHQVEVTARQVEALVALGVVGRVTSGGTTGLVWMRDGWAAYVPPSAADSPELEEFRLELGIDVERERLLLYRIALIFELIAAIIIVRQILVGAL